MEIAQPDPFHDASIDLMRKVWTARAAAVAACRMLGFVPTQLVHLSDGACRIDDAEGELARVWCDYGQATITVRREFASRVETAWRDARI